MIPPNGHAPPDAPDRRANDRLDSWGEIAAYLRRGVRTVRRWEREEGLPVHRHVHRKSGSVYAFKSELDDWWSNRSSRPNQPEGESPPRYSSRRGWILGICLLIGTAVAVWIKPGSPPRNAKSSNIRSLAVLPFESLSHNPKANFLARVMTEELITNLARSTPLRVVSWNSVTRYKQRETPLPEIARELDVDAVVEGSVQQVGEEVMLDVVLIDVRRDRHLWTKVYMGDSGDILTFQENTARSVAKEIRSALNLNRTKPPLAHPPG